MELTKEQVQKVDALLKNRGVKYWDIRIELLDHLVTDIERRIDQGDSFDRAKENSLHSLEINGNLKDLTRLRLKEINKIVRKQYLGKIKELLIEPIYLIPIIFFVGLYFAIYSFSSFVVFKGITLTFFLTPIIIGVIRYFSEFLYSKKSGYLIYTSFYIFFSFLMLNAFIQFVKPDGIIAVSEETQRVVWFLVTCANSIFSLAGILVHLKMSKKMKLIKEKLLSL